MEIKMSVEFVREAMFDYWLRGLCCPQHALLCIQASFQVTKLPICLVPNGSSKSLTAAAAAGGTTTAQLSSARLVFAFLARIDWKIVNIWHAILCILKDKSEKSTTPPGRVHREWQPERPRLKWTMMMMKKGQIPLRQMARKVTPRENRRRLFWWQEITLMRPWITYYNS